MASAANEFDSSGPGGDGGPTWPTVLLLHTLSDGSRHVDWLIAADPDGREPLITFRSSSRIDRLSTGEPARIERLEPHRSIYLDYEGPLTGGRGHVRRVARGQVLRWTGDDRRWMLEIAWDERRNGPAREPQRLAVTLAGTDRESEVAVLRSVAGSTSKRDPAGPAHEPTHSPRRRHAD